MRQHTIPPFIPLPRLARRYLPGPVGKGENYDEDGDYRMKPGAWPRQDLKRFAYGLRRELFAWHARRDAVGLVCEELGLAEESTPTHTHTHAGADTEDQRERGSAFGIVSVTATSADAKYIRVEWVDGRIGRVQISHVGDIEKVIVLGRHGRDHQTEAMLLGGDRKIESLGGKLKHHWGKVKG